MPSRDPDQRRATRTRYKRTAARWLAEYKSHCACKHCGETHPACLQFHHRDPSMKDFSISNAVGWGWSIARIEAEIAKCDVLCGNCHAKIHYAERQARKAHLLGAA